MICHDRQLIMIHVPKTGGTSLHTQIWPGSPTQHLLASSFPADLWRRYFSFGFVRNPYERLASCYCYHCRSDYQGELIDRIPELKSLSFIEYLDQVVRSRQSFDSRFKSMHELLHHPSGVPVDFIGRFETFEADARRVLDTAAISDPVAHKNKGPGNDYGELLGDNERLIIEELFAQDFTTFGYPIGEYR